MHPSTFRLYSFNPIDVRQLKIFYFVTARTTRKKFFCRFFKGNSKSAYIKKKSQEKKIKQNFKYMQEIHFLLKMLRVVGVATLSKIKIVTMSFMLSS